MEVITNEKKYLQYWRRTRQVFLKDIEKRAKDLYPKKRTTYKNIHAYIEEKYIFKVHTTYIGEVKRDLGLPIYDVLNVVEELKPAFTSNG